MNKPKVIINGQEVDVSQVTDSNGLFDKELIELIHLEQQHNNSQAGQKQQSQPAQIFVNGATIEGLSDLPPEVQQKLQSLQQLMPELLSGNPLTIFKNLGKLQKAGSAFLQISQQANQSQTNLGAQPLTTISTANQPITLSMNNNQNTGGSSHNTQYNSNNSGASTTPSFDNVKLNDQPFRSTTQNHNSYQPPSIYKSSSGDGLRRIIIIGALILIGYLVYEYVLNRQLPF
jgi:hypothetical protein